MVVLCGLGNEQTYVGFEIVSDDICEYWIRCQFGGVEQLVVGSGVSVCQRLWIMWCCISAFGMMHDRA